MGTTTTDFRVTTLGNLTLLTGTFRNGGKTVSYDGFLSDVMMAGGNITSGVWTGILVDDGSGVAAGSVAITVNNMAATHTLHSGQAIYKCSEGTNPHNENSTYTRIGIIAGMNGAGTSIEILGGTETALANDDRIYVIGPSLSAINAELIASATQVAVTVGIDEVNKTLNIACGTEYNTGITNFARDSLQHGKWFALGKR